MANMQKTEKQEVIYEESILTGDQTHASVHKKITDIVLTRPLEKGWLFALSIALAGLLTLVISIGWLVKKGIGIWGNNNPVGWAFDIINFVWWVGIAHAGTFISAILLLLKQKWRMSISRFSEAMTLFAVACAGTFPIIHLGRIDRAYWLFPYPNTMWMWPQFRSPLLWDVFAVSTYATVSLLFWYTGLIPDLAAMRDQAKEPWKKRIYGALALGWRGSAHHWFRYETACLLLAGLAAPLVLSVHTVVSLDFAVSVLPGWHTTVFPPYFVAGAVFSGFAMVITLCVPIRKWFGIEDLITMKHLDNMAKVIIATGLIVAYGYFMEVFIAWYSGNQYERFLTMNRFVGPYAAFYWALILCNVVIPQLFWIKSVRQNLVWLWVISIVVNIGMWLERFVIIVISLHRDFMPSSWAMYIPKIWDITTFVGSLGLFFTLLILFIRVLPMISIFEVQTIVDSEKKHADKH